MKIEVTRYWIDIYPECAADAAYIEEVIGLKNESDLVKVRRVNALRSHELVSVRIQKYTPGGAP